LRQPPGGLCRRQPGNSWFIALIFVRKQPETAKKDLFSLNFRQFQQSAKTIFLLVPAVSRSEPVQPPSMFHTAVAEPELAGT
jgi:hypothetical protein